MTGKGTILALGVVLAGFASAWGQAGEPPAEDFVKDLVEEYFQGNERTRFFAAAGVDGELTREEFAAAAGKDLSFVRKCDRWEAAIVHDRNADGRLNWTEAEEYRTSLRARLLAEFDKDRDGKLTGAERDAANAYLAGGVKPVPLPAAPPKPAGETVRTYPGGAEPAPAGGTAPAPGALADWQKRLADMRKEFDKDADGRLSAEESRAMLRAMRDRWEAERLKKWDKDGDGKISEEERKAEMDSYRKQAEDLGRQWLTRRFDKDGDGKLSEEERAAMEAEEARIRTRVEDFQKRWLKDWDTDGDGKLSDEERQKMMTGLRQRGGEMMRNWRERRYDKDGDGKLSEEERAAMEKAEADRKARMEKMRKEMDADGDGSVSLEETRKWWEGIRKKYDADGDGRLSDEERQKMFKEVYGTDGARGWSWPFGGGGGGSDAK